jgi:short-subunit dehydrogenase
MAALRKINLQDGVAVVTGAAGGIGAALALQLAEKGCHLALADVNGAGLAEVAAKAQAYGVKVSTLVLDMGQAESAQGLLDHVRAHHGRATVLINNAGVALGGQFEQVSEEDFDWLMSINFGAVVRLTRVFLPLLQQSHAGIIAPPGQTAYSAAKFAVRGFSEALRHELEAGNSSVRMTLLHPGGVRTGIATSARLPASVTAQEIKLHQKNWQKALRLSPEAAAQRILRGIERREPRVLVGDDAVAASWIQRLLPVSYWRWVARGMSRSFRDAV